MTQPAEQDPFANFDSQFNGHEQVASYEAVQRLGAQAREILEDFGYSEREITLATAFSDGSRLELHAHIMGAAYAVEDIYEGGIDDEPAGQDSYCHGFQIVSPGADGAADTSLIVLGFDNGNQLMHEEVPGPDGGDPQATARHLAQLAKELEQRLLVAPFESAIGQYLHLYAKSCTTDNGEFELLHTDQYISAVSKNVALWLQTCQDQTVKRAITQYLAPVGYADFSVAENIVLQEGQPATAAPVIQICIPREDTGTRLVYEQWQTGDHICFEEAEPGNHPGKPRIDFDPIDYAPTQAQIDELKSWLARVHEWENNRESPAEETADISHGLEIDRLISECETILAEDEGPFWLAQTQIVDREMCSNFKSTAVCEQLTRAFEKRYMALEQKFEQGMSVTPRLASELVVEQTAVTIDTPEFTVVINRKPLTRLSFIRIVQAKSTLDNETYLGPHILCLYDQAEESEALDVGHYFGVIPLKRANIPLRLQRRRLN